MTQHFEQSEDFTRVYVKSWLRVKDTLGTARAWAQHVERCCANPLDFVEPRTDDLETKEMLSCAERKV